MISCLAQSQLAATGWIGKTVLVFNHCVSSIQDQVVVGFFLFLSFVSDFPQIKKQSLSTPTGKGKERNGVIPAGVFGHGFW